MSHAMLSPSGASKWMGCPGSIAMEQGLPDFSSKYADEGTAAHFLASCWLNEGGEARHYLDRTIRIYEDEYIQWVSFPHKVDRTHTVDDVPIKVRSEWVVTEEMVGFIQKYVDNVKSYIGVGQPDVGVSYVEVKVPLENVTGEKDAHGTADLVVIRGNELQVHDLKYGRGVTVDAENNFQLMIYALGASNKFADKFNTPIETVRLVIHQPRKYSFPEFSMSVEDLNKFGETIWEAANDANDEVDNAAGDKSKIPLNKLVPGPHCRNNFCKARSMCPVLTGTVLKSIESTVNDFEDLTKGSNMSLSNKMKLIPIIEDWCKAVRAEVERKIFSGEDIEGFKLVQGKKGNRMWDDKSSLEKEMLDLKIVHRYIYDYKLVSPTTLEKHAKAKNITGPQWEKLQKHITQKEGVPSVAPSTDKRPAISVNPGDDFVDVTVTKSLEGLI